MSRSDDLATRFAAHLGDEVPVDDSYGQLTADVSADRWVEGKWN